jgi:hypothetical protein
MKKGRGNREIWPKAQELAEQGCWLSEAARILKVHHTTTLYISRQMGFKWPRCPERYAYFKPYKFVTGKKPVRSEVLPISNESEEYVERLMRLAGA